jgi:hypothetical protein
VSRLGWEQRGLQHKASGRKMHCVGVKGQTYSMVMSPLDLHGTLTCSRGGLVTADNKRLQGAW